MLWRRRLNNRMICNQSEFATILIDAKILFNNSWEKCSKKQRDLYNTESMRCNADFININIFYHFIDSLLRLRAIWKKYIDQLQEKYPESEIIIVVNKIKAPFGEMSAKLDENNVAMIGTEKRLFMQITKHVKELSYYLDKELGEESDYKAYTDFISRNYKNPTKLTPEYYEDTYDRRVLLCKTNLLIQITQMYFNQELFNLLIEQVASHFNNLRGSVAVYAKAVKKPTLVLSKEQVWMHDVYYWKNNVIYYPLKVRRYITIVESIDAFETIAKETDIAKLFDMVVARCINNRILEIDAPHVFEIFNHGLPYQRHWLVDKELDISEELNYFDKNTLVEYLKSCSIVL
jgi:hypothetical protein